MTKRFAYYVIADVYKSSYSKEKETFVFGYYDLWTSVTEKVGRVIKYFHSLDKKNFKGLLSLRPKHSMDLLVIGAMVLAPRSLVCSVRSMSVIESPSCVDGYSIIDLRDLDKIRVGFFTKGEVISLEEFVNRYESSKLDKVYSSKYVLQNMTKDDISELIEIYEKMNRDKERKEFNLIIN